MILFEKRFSRPILILNPFMLTPIQFPFQMNAPLNQHSTVRKSIIQFNQFSIHWWTKIIQFHKASGLIKFRKSQHQELANRFKLLVQRMIKVIFQAMDTSGNIVKDKSSHLVYLNIMNKITTLSVTCENLNSIGWRSCERMMEKKHPWCTSCVVSDAWIRDLSWGFKYYFSEKSSPLLATKYVWC